MVKEGESLLFFYPVKLKIKLYTVYSIMYTVYSIKYLVYSILYTRNNVLKNVIK